jgi:hypothetical protein
VDQPLTATVIFGVAGLIVITVTVVADVRITKQIPNIK